MKRLVLFLFIFALSIYGADNNKILIAVMNLKPVGVDDATAVTVSDLIRTELHNTGLFKIIERAQMEEILKEQAFQESGCTETECAVEIGRLLSANKILVGTVNKLGTAFIINARIVDVENGVMEFADKAKVESESSLDEACSVFARKIANRIKSESTKTVSKEKEIKPKKEEGFRLNIPSYIITALTVAPGTFWFLKDINLKKVYDDYKSLTIEDTINWTPEQWNTAWDKVLKAQKERDLFRMITIITAGTGITLFLTDLIFLRPHSVNESYNYKSDRIICLYDTSRLELYWIKRF